MRRAGARPLAPFAPEAGGPRACEIPADDHPADWPASSPRRRSRGRSTAASALIRPSLRHARRLGRGRVEHPHRQSRSTEGGALFPLPGSCGTGRCRSPRTEPFRIGRWTSRVGGLSRGDGRGSGGGARRGDRDARRRPDPGALHRRGQPGAVGAGRGASRSRAGLARVDGECRHLPATRRRGTRT